MTEGGFLAEFNSVEISLDEFSLDEFSSVTFSKRCLRPSNKVNH